jgi:hypothetical protein
VAEDAERVRGGAVEQAIAFPVDSLGDDPLEQPAGDAEALAALELPAAGRARSIVAPAASAASASAPSSTVLPTPASPSTTTIRPLSCDPSSAIDSVASSRSRPISGVDARPSVAIRRRVYGPPPGEFALFRNQYGKVRRRRT